MPSLNAPDPPLAQEQAPSVATLIPRRPLPRWRLLFGLLLGGVGLWLVTREVTPAGIAQALRQAQPLYIVFALLNILLTTLAKSWRWQLLFYPNQAQSPLNPTFWALTLGQMLNTILPVRVGDLARVYALDYQTKIGKARALGTLVVEKMLELVVLTITLFLLLPFVAIPQFAGDSRLALVAVSGGVFFALYLLAYQSGRVGQLLNWAGKRLPGWLSGRVIPLLLTGLNGLSALRKRRITALLIALSVGIGFLHLITPLLLFAAFNIPFGLREAAVLHLVLAVGSAPPATPPVNVGLFEFLVVYTLSYLGLTTHDLTLTYAVVFHLVILLPQVMLGSLAIVRLNIPRQS